MSKMHFLIAIFICLLTAPAIPVGAEETSHTQGDSYGLTNASLKAQEEMLLNLLADATDRTPTVNSPTPSSLDHAPNSDLQMEETLLAARELVPSPEDTEQRNELIDTVQSQRETIKSLNSSKLSLEKRLRVAESKLTAVLKELEQTREDLLLAETEVERLSYIIEKRNIDKIRTIQARSTRPVASLAAKSAAGPQQEAAPITGTTPAQEGSQEQISIATVTANKANLRTGPGLNNSVLLTVSKNSRLVVESRQGDWYRIIAPTGERAWISGSVIHFGTSASGRPNSILRIKGVSSSSPHQE